MLEEMTFNITVKAADPYIKCFDPLAGLILHFPESMSVKWVFALQGGERGRERCLLKDVPRTGLFVYQGAVYQRV